MDGWWAGWHSRSRPALNLLVACFMVIVGVDSIFLLIGSLGGWLHGDWWRWRRSGAELEREKGGDGRRFFSFSLYNLFELNGSLRGN